MTHISILVLPKALATSITLPMEMLSAAASAHTAQEKTRSTLTVAFVAATLDPVTVMGGMKIVPDATIDDIPKTDLVLIPGLWRNPLPILKRHLQLIPWLQQQHEQGAILSAVGTGALFLAETGLLDGKSATTHWFYFDEFERHYPNINLEKKHFITRADKLYTAGSVNSIADLTLHFINHFYNKSVANQVERHFTHEVRRSYESEHYLQGKEISHHDEDIIQCQQWLNDNYNKDCRLEIVASQFDMSLRSFNRRFKLATGTTPRRYIQEVRIDNAADLLKNSNLSISEIAFEIGYLDSGYFSGLFKRIMSITPNEYRRTIRGKLFTIPN